MCEGYFVSYPDAVYAPITADDDVSNEDGAWAGYVMVGHIPPAEAVLRMLANGYHLWDEREYRREAPKLAEMESLTAHVRHVYGRIEPYPDPYLVDPEDAEHGVYRWYVEPRDDHGCPTVPVTIYDEIARQEQANAN